LTAAAAFPAAPRRKESEENNVPLKERIGTLQPATLEAAVSIVVNPDNWKVVASDAKRELIKAGLVDATGKFDNKFSDAILELATSLTQREIKAQSNKHHKNNLQELRRRAKQATT
jgi:hypothetical protein